MTINVEDYFLAHFNIRKQSGFTLIELMLVVTIIAILGVVSTPSMQRYYYEAKAAQLLVNVHDIRLLYEEAVEVEGLTLKSDVSAYKSLRIGKAPSTFSEHDELYYTDGILLWSDLIKQNIHGFDIIKVKDKPVPVLWLQAKSDHGRKLLRAFDHITKQKHMWVMQDFMLLDLE